MILLRSVLYFIYLCLSTLFYSLLIILRKRGSSFRKISLIANSWGLSNIEVLKRICALDYRIVGLENIRTSNCIVMSKHQSSWETIAFRGIFPPEQAWVLKLELLKIPVFGSALRECQPIAIDRSSGRRAATK